MNVKIFTLRNSSGMTVEFLNFGGIVTRMMVPNRNGEFGNVVLGFDDPTDYVRSNPSYLGALIGRFANRIGGAEFTVDGTKFSLFKNDSENALHGGKKGFDKVFWSVSTIEENKSYRLHYISPDGEEGYPGNLEVLVTYSLTEDNEFIIDYQATTDRPTHVNLTHHGYFNLSSNPLATILDHELSINADSTTPSNASWIPTGEMEKVKGCLDFRKPRPLGERIDELTIGYNHNFVLNDPGTNNVAARLYHPGSGRLMQVRTTEPGLQFYSGFYLEKPYSGLALEAQHYPDTPNRPEFPSTLLRPGSTYRQTTVYQFLKSI